MSETQDPKTVRYQFRRHAFENLGVKRIRPGGMTYARTIGSTELRGEAFTQFSIGDWQTVQTLVAFAEGAGDFSALTEMPAMAPFRFSHLGLSEACERWRQTDIRNKDAVAYAMREDQDLCDEVTRISAGFFRSWDESLPDGSRVLVVGHSPEMELLLFRLTGIQIRQLEPCGGFRFRTENGTAIFEGTTEAV